MSRGDYYAACAAAATRQGLDPVSEALTALGGIGHAIEQTGGFCMVLTVTLAEGSAVIGVTASDDSPDRFLVCLYPGDTWHEGPGEDAVDLGSDHTASEVARVIQTLIRITDRLTLT